MSNETEYFGERNLLSPPMQRAAYSNRMAYVLGEMSGLAYFRFEGTQGIVSEAVKQVESLFSDSRAKKPDELKKEIEQLLSNFATEMYRNRDSNREELAARLNDAGFTLIEVFNVETTQGFLCRRSVDGEPRYLVLAFRGTEGKVEDWLTDANAIPKEIDGYRVHTGFYNAFHLVKKDIQEALELDDCFENGKLLPLYITGHSLGGALAAMATKYIAPNVNGACYTFGGPRVANYKFFFPIKTPIYRVVNSSDVVPRVPPGVGIQILAWVTSLMSKIFSTFPGLESLFLTIAQFLDKLGCYRHYGDLRYLTDVKGEQFEKVRLLYNPPAMDRLRWFLKHLAASFFMPLKSHTMALYRKKLVKVASNESDIVRQVNT